MVALRPGFGEPEGEASFTFCCLAAHVGCHLRPQLEFVAEGIYQPFSCLPIAHPNQVREVIPNAYFYECVASTVRDYGLRDRRGRSTDLSRIG
jgi:hypothetical protein